MYNYSFPWLDSLSNIEILWKMHFFQFEIIFDFDKKLLHAKQDF